LPEKIMEVKRKEKKVQGARFKGQGEGESDENLSC
jgi:hypothetical protein